MSLTAFTLPSSTCSSLDLTFSPINSTSWGPLPNCPLPQSTTSGAVSFSRTTRLGIVSDFTSKGAAAHAHRQQQQQQQQQQALNGIQQPQQGAFSYKAEDDGDFTLIDSKSGTRRYGIMLPGSGIGTSGGNGIGGSGTGRMRRMAMAPVPLTMMRTKNATAAAAGANAQTGMGNAANAHADGIGGRAAMATGTGRNTLQQQGTGSAHHYMQHQQQKAAIWGKANTAPTPPAQQISQSRAGTVQSRPMPPQRYFGQRGAGGGAGGNAANGAGQRRFGGFHDKPAEAHRPSVELPETCKLVQEIALTELNESQVNALAAEDLRLCGSLHKYNAAIMNKVKPRDPLTLARYENKQFFNVTTSEDPVMQQLRDEKAGNVYVTDTILSMLMAAPRTVNPFDILIYKEGDVIVFDKRRTSKIEYQTVNENWIDSNRDTPLEPDSINHPDKLAAEATIINQAFSQQILSKTDVEELEHPNPFLDALQPNMEPAAIAYRYRRFTLPHGTQLIVRCSLNAYADTSVDGKIKQQYMRSFAFNEWDSKSGGNIDWRQKLESQTGSVLATEIKHNYAKVLRWTAETVLANADQLRIGFVSRLNPRSNLKHVVLMTKNYVPMAFAAAANIRSIASLWGTFDTLLHIVRKQSDGSYILLRDPIRPVLSLYSTPDNAFAEPDLSEQGA